MYFKIQWKKTMTAAAAAAVIAGMLTGCGTGVRNDDKKVTVTVGNWPVENAASRPSYDKRRDDFMAANPDIIIQSDTWTYSTQTFLVKATANQLPTSYIAPFTETDKMRKSGYAADLTAAMKKYGFLEALNPSLIELVTDENGRVFALPTNAYAQGLYINKALFREAGLVNGDGSVMIPDTYEQLAEFAQIIREKTGRAGFVFPTTNNGGGWNFLNIAYSYGVEFVEQQANGKWKAVFDTPDFKKALSYLYDLKWKYNALSDNNVIDQQEQRKLFGTGQGAMTFLNPPASELPQKYGMKIEDLFVARVPAGEFGRYSQMGGDLMFIEPNATAEQIDACFLWMEFSGTTPKVNDEVKRTLADSAKRTAEINGIVLGRSAFKTWVNPERTKATQEAQEPYVNVDQKDYDDYFSFQDVIIKPEPPVAAQELYSVLDKAIQEVITNKNADIDALTKTAVHDFQVNHLDKLD